MKKTIIILSFLLLLSSCNNSQQEVTKKIEDIKKENTKIVKKTIKENTATGKVQKNNLENNKKEMVKKTIQTAPLEKGDLVAIMKTTNGTMKIKLFNNIVPNTVNNFVGLAQEGYYDGIIFHRVINNFMIQGGDPSGTGMGGKSLYGEKFDDEFSDKLKNIKYSVSMANSGPDTNGSQFFINENDNNYLDNKHSVFGQVIEGKENVDKIAKTKTNAQDKPVKDIKIIKLTIEEYNGSKLVDYKLDKKEAIKSYNDFLKAQKEVNKDRILKNGDIVSVNYTLTVDGKKIDSSFDRGEPFTFTLGKKMVIKGWDEGLLGHKIGDKFKLEVEPKDGYGEKNMVVPKTELQSFIDAGIKLEKGGELPTAQGNIKILDSDDKTITIENNNKLAGKKLFFDIEVVDIK